MPDVNYIPQQQITLSQQRIRLHLINKYGLPELHAFTLIFFAYIPNRVCLRIYHVTNAVSFFKFRLCFAFVRYANAK